MAGTLVTTNIVSTICAMGLATLRERLALVLIANREYERMITGATRFSTVNVAVPASVAARVVAADVVPPAVTAVTPTKVAVTLSQWYEAPFALDDKGLVQAGDGIIPMQAKEAIKGLANTIEDYLWSLLAAAIGNSAGTAGTTPFGSGLDDFLAADKVLNDFLADTEDRYMIINTAAKASAMGLRAIQDASFRPGSASLMSGEIGPVLGARWLMSQRVPTHTSGTLTGVGTTVTTVEPIGETVIALSGGASGTLIAGDIVRFGATSPYTYNVVSSVGGTTPSSVTIAAPGLIAATVGAEVVSIAGPSTVPAMNLLIQKNCLAFAMAPLIETVEVPGASMQAVAIDEISGLSLRLEVTRQHRQTQWAFDALYGGAVIRPTHACWLLG
jgi:hypothetical protein